MCPNCTRGLVGGELCTVCAGTGVWNPASVSVPEMQAIVEAQVQTEVVTVETPVEPTMTTDPISVLDAPAGAAPKAPKKKAKKGKK